MKECPLCGSRIENIAEICDWCNETYKENDINEILEMKYIKK